VKNDIFIEKANLDFFDAFYKIRCEDINIYWSGHINKPNYEDLKEWYIKQLDSKNRIIFCIKYLEAYVGYLYYDIDNNMNTIELSYAVLSMYNGLGIASKALKKAVNYSMNSKYQNMKSFYI